VESVPADQSLALLLSCQTETTGTCRRTSVLLHVRHSGRRIRPYGHILGESTWPRHLPRTGQPRGPLSACTAPPCRPASGGASSLASPFSMVFLFWQHCALHSLRSGAGGRGQGRGFRILTTPPPARLPRPNRERIYSPGRSHSGVRVKPTFVRFPGCVIGPVGAYLCLPPIAKHNRSLFPEGPVAYWLGGGAAERAFGHFQ